MVINRKALASLLVALGVALGVFGLLIPDAGTVAAQEASATRSLPASVAPGEEFVVGITASNYGSFGLVIETLPDGFTYVSTAGVDAEAVDALADGQVVTFTLFDDKTPPNTTFEYTVIAPDQAGVDHQFMGYLTDSSQMDYPVGGLNNTIDVVAPDAGPGDDATATPTATAVAAGGPVASRSISPDEVPPGGQVVVEISASNYGSFGLVIETLPDGFTYVATGGVDADAVDASADGQVVTFTLFDDTTLPTTTFTYTVNASNTPGVHSIDGDLRDSSGMDYDVGGDTDVTVEAPPPPSATRSFSSAYVDPDTELVVTIEATNYGSFGVVIETLPDGFAYESTGGADADAVDASADGQVVTFTLFDDKTLPTTTFTYTVTAPTTEDSYTFSGVLRDSAGMDYPLDDSTIMVGTAPEPATATPTATPPAPTDPDRTPKATRTPRPTPIPQVPSTPVVIEIVSDVTMAEGATVVQPDASSVISSSDGMATVMLPNTSRARTYQVMISSDAAGCSGGDLAGAQQACATITAYDAEGNMESGVMLIRRATVVMTLDAAGVEDLGGLPVVFQANALGAFSVYQRDDADDSWGMRRFTMGLTDDGGITVTVTSLRALGSLALAVDEDILQTAMYQVAGITPTPVPTAVVVAPVDTATPVPTAVPTPEPTAVPPEEEKPPVGDTTLPVGLLVVLTLTGALMVYTGSRVMRRKPAATRR